MSTIDQEFEDTDSPVTLQKWLVDVRCDGCKGLFYRSAPNVIVPDADWPRNGDVVVGHELTDVPGENLVDRVPPCKPPFCFPAVTKRDLMHVFLH